MDSHKAAREFARLFKVDVADKRQKRACPEGCACAKVALCPNGLDTAPAFVFELKRQKSGVTNGRRE